MRQRLLNRNHLYASAGGFRDLTLAKIQCDVANGRGAEGADPKRSDTQAGREEQVAGTEIAFVNFVEPAAGNRALTLESDSPWRGAALGSGCGSGAAADVYGAGGKQQQGGSKQSAAEDRCSHGYFPCKKKALTSVQGPEVVA